MVVELEEVRDEISREAQTRHVEIVPSIIKTGTQKRIVQGAWFQ